MVMHPSLAKQLTSVRGVRVIKKNSQLMKQLESDLPPPVIHGYRVWSSSFLIMDYLQQQPLSPRSQMMEIGCGWGILGIFCAKQFGAKVTALDADGKVFPFLEAHSAINDVYIDTLHQRYEQLAPDHLRRVSLMAGGDICFWDELVDPLFEAIRAGVDAGVERIIIADPGRPPFMALAKRCKKAFGGHRMEWQIRSPKRYSGHLLVVES